jgi:hypothetical protein
MPGQMQPPLQSLCSSLKSELKSTFYVSPINLILLLFVNKQTSTLFQDQDCLLFHFFFLVTEGVPCVYYLLVVFE